jgi:hypothetical protein
LVARCSAVLAAQQRNAVTMALYLLSVVTVVHGQNAKPGASL